VLRANGFGSSTTIEDWRSLLLGGFKESDLLWEWIWITFPHQGPWRVRQQSQEVDLRVHSSRVPQTCWQCVQPRGKVLHHFTAARNSPQTDEASREWID